MSKEPEIEKPRNMAENRVEYTQWLKRGNSTFIPTDNAVTQPKVDAGIYNVRYEQNVGYFLVKKDVILDDLINLPSPEGDEVLKGIKTFWERKEKFQEYGYAYKRGILLYGVPGGGKTSIINLLSKELIGSMDGIVVTISTPSDLTDFSRFMPEIYRSIEPTRPIICTIEDIDGLCQAKDTETLLLNVLDGLEQLDNIIYIATTNYTERLPDRIMNRPNRFDIRVEVKSPNDECRRIYFKHKLKPEDLESIPLERWVSASKGLTIAHLGEIVKSVAVLGNTFEQTIENMQGFKKVVSSRNYNAEFEKSIGFNP